MVINAGSASGILNAMFMFVFTFSFSEKLQFVTGFLITFMYVGK